MKCGVSWVRAGVFRRLRRCVSGMGLPAVALLAATSVAGRAQTAYSFSPQPIQITSQTQTVQVTFQAAGQIGSISVGAQGAAGLEFAQDTTTAPPSSPCVTTQTYAKGDTCNVAVTFRPQYPGLRQGAVVVTSNTNPSSVLATVFLSGTGQGALEVMTPGVISTFAGNSHILYDGDDKPAGGASLYLPESVQMDAAGNLYIADQIHNRIRVVYAATSPIHAGLIETIAGNGSPGFSGDGGQATAAELNLPGAIALDGAGNLYISDTGNDVIRRVDAVTGKISTIAGQAGQPWFSGDGGQATAAFLDTPEGLAFDTAGNLYVSDAYNSEIRKIDIGTGIISAYAGMGGNPGNMGNGGQATAAQLNAPWGIAFGPDGSLYIADLNNNVIRKVDTTGVITTVVGTGTPGFTGDGGAATAADLNSPGGVAVDPAGNLYIADSTNNLVRKVVGGNIETIVGRNADSATGDSEPSTQGGLYEPYGLTLDGYGNLYIADMLHNTIREVNSSLVTLTYDTIRQGRTSAPQTETIENDGNSSMTLTQLEKVSNVDLDPNATLPCSSGQTITAGTFCNLGVEFLPTVTGNPVTGQLLVKTSAFNSPATINLTGQVLSTDPTATTLAANPNPATVGISVLFTATVTDTNSVTVLPTGTVEFFDGTTDLGHGTVDQASGTATFSTSALALGSHSITAVYSGDDNNYTSTSSAVIEVIKQASTTTLGTSGSPSLAAQSVTFTATVTAPSGTPSGSVTFKDGSTTLGTGTLSGGVAMLSTSALTAAKSPHSITAVYSGDSLNIASTSQPLTQTVNLNASATTLGTSNAEVVAGASITLTAQVTSSGPAPTGTVTFQEGATILGTGTVNGSGAASLDLTTLAVGAHQLTAVYSGDGNDATSTSTPALAETIDQIATTTVVGASSAPAGAKITLTATVTPAETTGGTLSGATVTFKDGSTTLGTGTVNGSGVATLDLTTLGPGPHSITAVYGGATNFKSSTSTSLGVTIDQATTSTALISSQNPQAAGKAVTFTATVTGNGGIPGGTVTFKDGTATLGSGTLNGQGAAVLTTSTLTAGPHNITAVYAGDTNDIGSTSTVLTQNVSQAASATVLNASPSSVTQGALLSLTATVTGDAGTPGGTVQFEEGSTVLGTGTLNGVGVASFSTSALPSGSHNLTAVYGGDTNHQGSTSAVVTVKVLPTTTVSLTSNANPAAAGATLALTAAVSGQATVPTGTVTFKDGTTVLGSAPVDGTGRANLPTSSLSIGPHSLTASYSGDAANAASVSTIWSQQIQQATTQTQLTTSAQNSPAGAKVALTASVTGNGGIPGGQVTFKDGATVLGATTLNASGLATLPVSTLNVATHSITAVYAGDTNDAGSTSVAVTVVINAASSSVSLVSSANPSLYQSPLLLTATVTAAAGTATGTVTFSDGATVLGSSPLSGAGVATLSVSTLAIGPHTIVAAYSGDANRSASQSAALNQSVLQQTTTVLTPSANPATASARLVLTATVTGQSGAAATGTVTFTDGATPLGSAALNGAGVATLSTTTLTVGPHAITAAYSGDTKSQASSSAVLAETVISATTQVTLTASANPSTAGTPLTFTAHVVSLVGGAPTGSVTFMDGTAALGSAPLAAGGVATLTLTTLAPGPHTITAVYSGDGENSTSTSASLTESVLQTTTTALTSSLNPAQVLDAITLTATVANGGSTPATGTVTFVDGSTTLGKVTLTGGVAVLQLPSLAAASHSITANYSGDAQDFASASTALIQTVTLRPTTETLTSTTVPPGINQQVTLISVVRWTGPAAPTGTVLFTSGGTVLGTSGVDSTGVATLTINLTGSSMQVVSSYSGDAAYAPSSSTPTTVSSTTPTQFLITADSTAATIPSKQYTVIHITITSENGFADLMKLGCLGLPYAATCTFSADSVSLPADGKQTVTLTLDTGSPLTAGGQAKVQHGSSMTLAWLLPGGLLFGLAGWRGRRRLGGLVLLLLIGLALTTGLTGCASGLNINGTPAGSYTVKVTATGNASGATELMNFQLTVQ